MNELALIDRLRMMDGVSGIGDDCAVFRPKATEDLLLKTDQLIEGVHFLKTMRPEAIGERALARPLSDIAAAGGNPRCCLVALAVPRTQSERWVRSFFRGLLGLGKKTRTVLVGGDLAHDDKVHCSVMVVGAVARGQALTRDGARLWRSLVCLRTPRENRGISASSLGLLSDGSSPVKRPHASI
jgi:thiamine-monophosphate kinase